MIEGLPWARFNLVVDETGAVVDVRPLESGHKAAERAVLDAVRTWRFEPCLLDGQPVGVMYTLKVDFAVSGYPRITLW